MVLHVQLETSMEDQESIYAQTVPDEAYMCILKRTRSSIVEIDTQSWL